MARAREPFLNRRNRTPHFPTNKQSSRTVPPRGPTPLAPSVCERIFFHFCLTTVYIALQSPMDVVLKWDFRTDSEMKWHTIMDLLAHACVPNVDIGHLLSSICFYTLISRDGGNFRTQLNFFRVLCSYSWYLSQASINDRYLDCQWNWAWFFNKTIQQNQY